MNSHAREPLLVLMCCLAQQHALPARPNPPRNTSMALACTPALDVNMRGCGATGICTARGMLEWGSSQWKVLEAHCRPRMGRALTLTYCMWAPLALPGFHSQVRGPPMPSTRFDPVI